MQPTSSQAGLAKILSRFRVTPVVVILLANVILVLFFQLVAGQDLFGLRTMATLTPLLGVMVLVGLSQSFVIGTGGIDLSLPMTMTFMGIVILKVSEGANERLPQALLVGLMICVVIGIINGFLIEVVGLNSFVTTLATGQIFAGATIMYRGVSMNTTKVPEALYIWAQSNIQGVSVILITSVAVAVLISLFVKGTTGGRRLVAASASARAAKLLGFPQRFLRIGAWVISACIGGAAGVLLAGQLASPDITLGSPYLLSSIIVVVLGGAVLTGGRVGPLGTLLGAVFIILLDHGLSVMGLSTGARTFAQGAILALGLAGVGYLRTARPQKATRGLSAASKEEESLLV
jgi:ribose transport system permease protein